VFGPDVCLCNVFDFGEDVPIWAQSNGVELVTLSSNGIVAWLVPSAGI
jgi:hypothetical protein